MVAREGQDHAAHEPRYGGRDALNKPVKGIRVFESLRAEPGLGTCIAVLVLTPLLKCARKMRCAGASDLAEIVGVGLVNFCLAVGS